MFNKSSYVFFSALLIMSVMAVNSCFASEKPDTGDMDSGYLLRYKMEHDKTRQYEFSSTETTNSKSPESGKEAITESIQNYKFSVRYKKEDANHNMVASIVPEEMRSNSRRPDQTTNTDFSNVIGKSFEMTLSPLGKVLGYSGADDLICRVNSSDKALGRMISLKPFFSNIFLKLPENPLKMGEPQTANRTIDSEDGSTTREITTTYTLEGIEKRNSRDCLRIKINFNGHVKRILTGPWLPGISGDIDGTSVVYFDHIKGVILEVNTVFETTGEWIRIIGYDLTVSGPFTSVNKSKIELIQ